MRWLRREWRVLVGLRERNLRWLHSAESSVSDCVHGLPYRLSLLTKDSSMARLSFDCLVHHLHQHQPLWQRQPVLALAQS